jgi:hypothetical protein
MKILDRAKALHRLPVKCGVFIGFASAVQKPYPAIVYAFFFA